MTKPRTHWRGPENATGSTHIDHLAVARLRREVLPEWVKGLPLGKHGRLTIESISRAGWSVLDETLPFPLLVLKEPALEHNINAMATFCARANVLLAPHGKTTMSPQIFERQIAAGCWALTAATPAHLSLYRQFGVDRVVYANELVEVAALRWIAAEMRRDPSFDFYCLSDSVRATALMSKALASEKLRAPLNVLIEVGHEGGRAGCRTVDDVVRVATAVADSPELKLVGLETFEGTLAQAAGESDRRSIPSAESQVSRLLDAVAASARSLVQEGFVGGDGLIVSAGGSAYVDVVVGALNDLKTELPIVPVVRSGSYVTHDDGYYAEVSPFGSRSAEATMPKLESALEVWSVVLSRPEPDLIILGAGKRDLSIDLGLPIPTRYWSATDGFSVLPKGSALSCGVSDQHLHVRIDPQVPIDVGDLCACAISHPCTAFDKWRLIPVVDNDLSIIDALWTFF